MNLRLGLMMSVLLSMVPVGSGQESETPESTVNASEQTHEQLRAVRDGLLEAIEAKDADALIAYLDEDVVLTAQAGDELDVFRKHDGVRGYLERLLTGANAGVKSLSPNIEVDELTILHGGDTGIAFGSSNDHYVMADGSEFELKTRWSATLVKADEQWKVANLHVSSNLFDNPVLAVATKSVSIMGGIAAVVGLMIGCFIGWRLGRR